MLIAQFHDSLDATDAATWDALRPDDNPFVSHGFLAGLERCGCIRTGWGWQPHHVTLHDGPSPCRLSGIAGENNVISARLGLLPAQSHGTGSNRACSAFSERRIPRAPEQAAAARP